MFMKSVTRWYIFGVFREWKLFNSKNITRLSIYIMLQNETLFE